MKQETYAEPTIEVVEIEVETPLLAGSDGVGSPGDYPYGGDPLKS